MKTQRLTRKARAGLTLLLMALIFTGIKAQSPLSVTVNTRFKCGDTTGSAAAHVKGGNPFIRYRIYWHDSIPIPYYHYEWSNGDTTRRIHHLTTDDYCVTVTDASGNTATACDSLIVPTAPLSVILSSTCLAGDSLMDISSAVTGGTGPYTYRWIDARDTTSSLDSVPVGRTVDFTHDTLVQIGVRVHIDTIPHDSTVVVADTISHTYDLRHDTTAFLGYKIIRDTIPHDSTYRVTDTLSKTFEVRHDTTVLSGYKVVRDSFKHDTVYIVLDTFTNYIITHHGHDTTVQHYVVAHDSLVVLGYKVVVDSFPLYSTYVVTDTVTQTYESRHDTTVLLGYTVLVDSFRHDTTYVVTDTITQTFITHRDSIIALGFVVDTFRFPIDTFYRVHDIITEPIQYVLLVTDANGCSAFDVISGCGSSDTSGHWKDLQVSAQPASDLQITAYPNPFGSQAQLKVVSSSTENISVRIFDITGRLMDNKPEVPVTNEITLGAGLPSGVYLIEVTQGSNRQVTRIIKSE